MVWAQFVVWEIATASRGCCSTTSTPWLLDRCREQGIPAVKKQGSSFREDGETETYKNEPVAELLCGKRREMGTAGDTGPSSV